MKKHANRLSLFALALMALALMLAPTPQPAASSQVREKAKVLALEIKQLLEDEGAKEIDVGEFTGPSHPSTSAGPMIQAALIDELKKAGVAINPKAKMVVKGEYYILDDARKKDELVLRLEATVRNSSGRRFGTLSQELNFRNNEDLVKLLALSIDNTPTPNADRDDINKELKKATEEPPAAPKENKAQVNPAGPYAVEVLVHGAGGKLTPVKPTVDKGLMFVELEKGCEYVLRLHNNSKYEAAASITIDGLDVFQFFKPEKEKPKYYIVGAGKTAQVRGWVFSHNKEKNEAKTHGFLVTDFANSAAAKGLGKEDLEYQALRGSKSIGTITVIYAPCWEKDKTPDEYKGSRSADDKATGIGSEAKIQAKRVDRTVHTMAQAISIRYKK